MENSSSNLPIIAPALLHNLAVPTRRWIVEDWLPFNTTTTIYGNGGEGKSLLAMQLATAVTLGKNWLGYTVPKMKVLCIFCEDTSDELHRRQADINSAYECEFTDLDDMQWYSGVGEDNLLVIFDGNTAKFTELYEKIRRKALEFGAQLIIIDTAADTFGGNENFRAQVRSFINLLNRLALEVDGAVLLCAHPSVAGMASGDGSGGSTAWHNSVRSRWYLHRPQSEDGSTAQPDVRILSRRKANYAAANDEIILHWREGVFYRDEPVGGFIEALAYNGKQRAIEEYFLRTMDEFARQARHLSASKNSGNYAPKLMLMRNDRGSFSKRDLEQAMHSLFNARRIRNEPYGRGTNPPVHIVKIENQEA